VPNLPGTKDIELVRPDSKPKDYRFAIFDFDGTVSLLREGWREIMIPMMVTTLIGLREGETKDELEAIVSDFVDALTGQQTIFQMIRLCEEIRARGGRGEEPVHYKTQFHDLLLAHIEGRGRRLSSGEIEPDDMTVPGIRQLLEALKSRGLMIYLASGTDHDYVIEEAKLLEVDGYFNGGMYGARDNYQDFSKAKLIAEILQKNELGGDHLLGFGDGYVEIENVSRVGGTAVGVASNESTRSGINAWKRERLITAGAALIIPDYRELDPLLAYLFPDT
jgi:phosphoglycolate phosphatase-like HAD superfamily hydrolase